MFRMNDLILFAVLTLSILAAVFYPRQAGIFQPYIVHMLMAFMFLSFITVKVTEIGDTIKASPGRIVLLTVMKMAVAPVIIYYLFKLFMPEYAVSALLLAGVSTGVVAPFISGLVQANTPLVFVLVVVTAPLVPFTLPALVELLVGQSISISFWGMARMLAQVIFIPIAVIEILRRGAPPVLAAIQRGRYPILMCLFATLNLGIFSQYSDFFRQNPAVLIHSAAAALILGGIFIVVGFLCQIGQPMDDLLAGAVIFTNINNILVLVFASQFFGPLEPTSAAMYMLPFFLSIIPFRIVRRLMEMRA